jgi:hypothetical protein
MWAGGRPAVCRFVVSRVSAQAAALAMLMATSLCACSGDGGRPNTGPTRAPSSTALSGPRLVPTVSLDRLPVPVPGADLPPTTVPRHGDVVWAAYLAVARTINEGPGVVDQSHWNAAIARLRSNGLDVPDGGELACDEGASEALRDLGVSWGTALYFASKADAERFASQLRPSAIRVVEVRYGCAD